MIGLQVDRRDLDRIVRHLRAEENGAQLRRDLAKNIRHALRPAVAEAKASIRSMPSTGALGKATGEGLRQAIARRVRAEARLSGRAVGARVKVRKTGMPRGFENAAKRTNRAKGWRHPVFGNRDAWAHQIGKPEWFDGPMRANRAEYRRAVRKAMADAARRITRR